MTWKITVVEETGKADKIWKSEHWLRTEWVGAALLKPCAPERSKSN
jgi:hypothetical protein